VRIKCTSALGRRMEVFQIKKRYLVQILATCNSNDIRCGNQWRGLYGYYFVLDLSLSQVSGARCLLR
jgi:hypothetical protein